MTFYSHYPGLTCSPDTCPSASLRCPGGCSRLPCAEDLFHSRPANCERFLSCGLRGCSIEVKEVNSKINRAANHSKVSKTVEIIRFGHIIKTFITFAKRTQYEREGHLWQSQLGPAQHGLHLPQTALSHCCMESLDLLHVPANHVFSISCPSRVWSERPTLGQSSKTGALWCPRHSLTAICDPGFNLLMI